MGPFVTILILGGTGEALELARRLAAERPDWPVVTSLAGRTVLPDAYPLPGKMRVGGFGGAEGLARWMTGNGVTALVDATHPFARIMAGNAVAAAALTGTPLMKLAREPWVAGPDDRWVMVENGTEAALWLKKMGKRPFLTVGRQGLAPFLVDPVPWALVRLLEPDSFPGWEIVIGRGPFAEADESALMSRYGIDVVVTKASGGAATEAKLGAARKLGIPVLMIARPLESTGSPLIKSQRDALKWLDRVLARSGD